jgi:hypothetical protein
LHGGLIAFPEGQGYKVEEGYHESASTFVGFKQFKRGIVTSRTLSMKLKATVSVISNNYALLTLPAKVTPSERGVTKFDVE